MSPNSRTPCASSKGAPRARDFAAELHYRSQELLGFLTESDLSAEMELEVGASVAAAIGLIDRATRRIEADGPG